MTLKTEFEREGNGRMGEDGICALLTIDQKVKRKRNEYEKETNKNESDKEDISLNLMVKEREEYDSQVDLP